jgi:two-component system phosphate regulon sensor histidine kinase PhoR
MHFAVSWVPPATSERGNAILLRGTGMSRLHTVEVTGYRSFLLRRILSQFLFALTLVAITTLAFLLALWSLRRERRLSLMRSSLVSNMSHELKTPVTTVKVALEALGDDDVLRDRHTVREYVSIANQELQRLELLVNQTLHTSLMESGKLPIQRTSIDLQLLTIELVNSLQPRIEKQSARVQLSFEDGDYSIDADKLHVQGVLLNIMDNALKYGGDGVIIQVIGKSDDKSVSISVSDNGPGIPKVYQQRVFEKFFRVPAGDLHNVKGYGLGLSYAAEVMRLHGGTIRLDMRTQSGCTFTIEFPKKTGV